MYIYIYIYDCIVEAERVADSEYVLPNLTDI